MLRIRISILRLSYPNHTCGLSSHCGNYTDWCWYPLTTKIWLKVRTVCSLGFQNRKGVFSKRRPELPSNRKSYRLSILISLAFSRTKGLELSDNIFTGYSDKPSHGLTQIIGSIIIFGQIIVIGWN